MKNDYSKTLGLLRKWVEIIEKGLFGLTVVEAVLLLIIGVASSNIYHKNYANIYIVVLLVTGFLYLLIVAFKVAYKKKLPSSIVDELEAKYKLERIDGDLNRILNVNKIINKTIENISDFDPDVFSEDNLEKGQGPTDLLMKLFVETISPFAENMEEFFSSISKKFTVGIYMREKSKIKIGENEISNPIILRDDFKTASDILNKLHTDVDLKGWHLDLKAFFKSSMLNDRYEVSEFKDDFNKRVIICNPITLDRGFMTQKAVLFIITEKRKADLPFDLESVIKIFSNLILLWMETIMLVTLSTGVSKIFKAFFGGNTKKPKDNANKTAISNEPEK